jgi:hypothetical protein
LTFGLANFLFGLLFRTDLFDFLFLSSCISRLLGLNFRNEFFGLRWTFRTAGLWGCVFGLFGLAVRLPQRPKGLSNSQNRSTTSPAVQKFKKRNPKTQSENLFLASEKRQSEKSQNEDRTGSPKSKPDSPQRQLGSLVGSVRRVRKRSPTIQSENSVRQIPKVTDFRLSDLLVG